MQTTTTTNNTTNNNAPTNTTTTNTTTTNTNTTTNNNTTTHHPPDFLPFPLILRISALLAATTVIGMLLIFFTTGVGQDPLQFVHSVSDYTHLLLRNPPALRAAIALDNFFIVFYTTTFIALAIQLLRAGAHRGLTLFALSLLILLAFLDMLENHHFLLMIARAELSLLPSPSEISLQVWESLIKFHVSYLGLFLLGFAIPLRTRAQKTIAALSWFVQLPVGILIYVVPRALSVPLVFVRFSYFVSALVLVAVAFGRSEAGSNAPA